MIEPWQTTPVFITNRDNLTRGFSDLVNWLLDIGMENIWVLNNGSTLPALLEYYLRLTRIQQVKLMHIGQNLGPYALWEQPRELRAHPFILTDPDLSMEGCPPDLIARMHQMFDRFPECVKVGPSLRIDDLPDHYDHKWDVLNWEKQFWDRPLSDGSAYTATIDTTFALYRAGSAAWPGGLYLRLAPPYQVRHLPWYENSSEPNVERDYYRAHARATWVNW